MTTPLHDPGADDDGAEELEFHTHRGATVRFGARFGPDSPLPGREPMVAREVTLGSGWRVLQHRLPMSARGNTAAYAALEREISAAVALERRYESEPYVELFTRVVGYNFEAMEPFVLYRVPDGKPVGAGGASLTGHEQREIINQLALSVRLLEDVGLVHRAITPFTVRWDGKHIRLAEPHYALRTGEPRGPLGAAPWAAPEQRDGTGTADPRDDLWSVAQLVYFLLAGRQAPGDGPPADLAEFRQLGAVHQGGVFAARAAERPSPAQLMRLLNVPDPHNSAPVPADPLASRRLEFDSQLSEKRRELGFGRPPVAEPERTRPGRGLFGKWVTGGQPTPPEPVTAPRPTVSAAVLCPHCLLPVTYDENNLFVYDAMGRPKALDLSGKRSRLHTHDALSKAFQRCPHAEHYLPVPYLTNGEPLTIAMVGSSGAGKTHLLAAMLGEVEQGGLEPYGLKCRPLNPRDHRDFLMQVQRLHHGEALERTPEAEGKFAHYADGLLVSGQGRTRPVLFYDLSGEDLKRDDDVTTFLMGTGAFLFVVDPLRALNLDRLDPVRDRERLTVRGLGDEAINTVLGRIPRAGRYIEAPSALVLNKSDLIRLDPSVDRWLGRGLPQRLDAAVLRDESRDAYAFIREHSSPAWLRPFQDCARCTLHFVTATGSQRVRDGFPHGVRPRRILAPLLSIFSMTGVLPGPELREVGL